MTTGNPQLLVVDDDTSIREAIAEVLEADGYAVQTAANGALALEKLHGMGRPCLIVLDLMMPVMNGWEVMTALQNDAELKGVPVLIVSAHGQSAPAGATAFLGKPFSLDALLDLVHEHCGTRH